MGEEKKLVEEIELSGIFVMTGGIEKGKVVSIEREDARRYVITKELGFPLSQMTAAYFTAHKIKPLSKSEVKKIKREKQKKKGIKDAIAKTKKVEAKVTKKATKKTAAKKATASTKVVEQEKVATNAALSWFTQVLADSIGGI